MGHWADLYVDDKEYRSARRANSGPIYTKLPFRFVIHQTMPGITSVYYPYCTPRPVAGTPWFFTSLNQNLLELVNIEDVTRQLPRIRHKEIPIMCSSLSNLCLERGCRLSS